jgi:hypothetical protein
MLFHPFLPLHPRPPADEGGNGCKKKFMLVVIPSSNFGDKAVYDKADYDKVKGLSDATFDITGIAGELKPMQTATLTATKPDGTKVTIPHKVRLDTPAEVDYYNAGGILAYVLDQILA